VLYSAEARGYFDSIQTDWVSYEAATDEFIEYAKAGEADKGLQMITAKIAPLGTSIRDNFLALSDVVSTNADLRAGNTLAQGTMAIWIMVAVLGAGIIISLALAAYISRLIGNPLKKMAIGAEQLALGDVDIALDTAERRDEVGQLTGAFLKVIEGRKKQVEEVQQMADGDLTVSIQAKSDKDVLNKSLSHLVESLHELVVSIMSTAEQVASGAGLVSNSSMALSQGATEQASSVQQLTASLQEIASQTTINAQNAQAANDSARNVKDNAEAGNAQMQGMLKAMEEINQSSGSIGKIIKVIDDIAFQTNILALNAAVEAARAGQHGKGFAVVAEEVRTLAAKSAQAAKETTGLIEGSIRKVEAGTKIANETAAALGKIVTEVGKAADLIESIAVASSAQASAIEQVNQGVVQVSTVVQTNAATSEESAAASEELSSQAEQLRELVSTFKVHAQMGRQTFKTDAPQARAARKLSAGSGKPSISLTGGDFGKY
jgi:methyl-accepting chemotaxis protein